MTGGDSPKNHQSVSSAGCLGVRGRQLPHAQRSVAQRQAPLTSNAQTTSPGLGAVPEPTALAEGEPAVPAGTPASLPVLRAGRPSRRRARKNLRSFAKLLFPACCSTYRPFGVEGQSCWVAVPAPQTGRDYLPTDTRRRAQAALPHPGAQSTPTHLHATQVSEIQGEAPAWHRTAPVRQQQGKEMRV